MGGERDLVHDCPTADCQVYYYRRGRDERPGRRRNTQITPAHQAAMQAERRKDEGAHELAV
jgi:hypothetical protein